MPVVLAAVVYRNRVMTKIINVALLFKPGLGLALSE